MNKKYILILLSLSFLFSDDKKSSFKYSDNKWYIGSSYSPARYLYFPIIIGNAQNGLEFSLGFLYQKEIDDDHPSDAYYIWDENTSQWINDYNNNDHITIDENNDVYEINLGLTKYFTSFEKEDSKGSFQLGIGGEYYNSSNFEKFHYGDIDELNHNINEYERITYGLTLGYLVEYFFKKNFSLTLRTGISAGYHESTHKLQFIDYENGSPAEIYESNWSDADVYIDTNHLSWGFKYYFNTKK